MRSSVTPQNDNCTTGHGTVAGYQQQISMPLPRSNRIPPVKPTTCKQTINRSDINQWINAMTDTFIT